MAQTKIVVSIDEQILRQLDALVAMAIFPNRSLAIKEAVQEKLELLEQEHLPRECAKLDPALETALVEEGFAQDASEWPEY